VRFIDLLLGAAAVLATLALALLLWKLVRYEVATALCPPSISCPAGHAHDPARGGCSKIPERTNP
jgi:hypothetical protein